MLLCKNTKLSRTDGEAHAHVLLAEADYAECRRMETILRSYSVDVDTASDGLGVLGLVRRNTYDLVFLAADMPLMKGLEAAHFLQADSRYCNLPLIALCLPGNEAFSGEREQLLSSGFAKCLYEPVAPEVLRNEVAIFASGKKIPEQRKDFPVLPEKMNAPEKNQEQNQDNPWSALVDFDIKQGLARVMLNEKLYRRLLIDFEKDLNASLAELQTASAQGISVLLAPLHKIKGTSGNMAAVQLHTETVALEKIFKSAPDMPEQEWRPHFAEYLQTVQKTIDELAAFHTLQDATKQTELPHTEENPAEDAVLADLLQHTLQDVQAYMTTALDIFAKARELLGSRFPAEQQRIQEALESFDFEKAQTELLALTKILKTDTLSDYEQ